MDYKLIPSSQQLGTRQYIAHEIETHEQLPNLSLLTGQVENFGVLEFGEFEANIPKVISLSSAKIYSPILIRSVYSFAVNAVTDSILFRILRDEILIAQLSIPSADMPLQFPLGAIVMPDMAISIRPPIDNLNINVYWQPVNIIHRYALEEQS